MEQNLFFFDIETIADESRSELWKSKESEFLKDGKEFKPALFPEFCKIVALGWAIDDNEPESLVVDVEKDHKDGSGQRTKVTEKHILLKFWELISRKPTLLVGFNILKFDLPVIFVRSAHLSVKPRRFIDRRPWGKDCLDLLETRQFTNGGGKLKELARYFDFNVPVQDTDGSDVERLFRDDPIRLSDYVESDITVTRQLYEYYKGFFVPDYTPSVRQIRETSDTDYDIEST